VVERERERERERALLGTTVHNGGVRVLKKSSANLLFHRKHLVVVHCHEVMLQGA